MKTLTITFNPDHTLDERVRYMDKKANKLKGKKLTKVTLNMGNEPDMPYAGYDGIMCKMLLTHAKALVIEYETK